MKEFEKSLSIQNLLSDPAGVSSTMIEADRVRVEKSKAPERTHGPVLVHQLEKIDTQIQELLNNPAGVSGAMVGADGAGSERSEAADSNHGGGPAGVSGTMVGADGAGSGKSEAADSSHPGGPAGVSGTMVGADGVGSEKSEAPDSSHGSALVHQLEKIDAQIKKAALAPDQVNLYDLAMAVYDMKKELLVGIEEQKAMGIVYLDEGEIVDKAHEITDHVLIQLIKEEYQSGKTPIPRLAQIIRRLIPDPDELKRTLPKLKEALLAEGMPMPDFLELIKHLAKELQSDELAQMLKESAEEMGLDSEALIKEFKQSPQAAAELIYLAAEIRKGTGDETVLSDLLVDYIERIGSGLCIDLMAEEEEIGDSWLQDVITKVQTEIVDRLKSKAIDPGVLNTVEERLNQRIDAIFEKVKSALDLSPSASAEESFREVKSTLKLLEEGVRKGEPLYDILQNVRKTFQKRGLDENNLTDIVNELTKTRSFQERMIKRKDLPKTVLNPQNSLYLLEREIARSSRYGTPFSMMGFAIIRAVPQKKDEAKKITQEDLEGVFLQRLAVTVRDTDTVGYLGKNKMISMMTMTHEVDAKRALQRNLKLLHAEPFTIKGVQVKMRIAGVTHDYNEEQTPTVQDFIKRFSTELFDMVIRLRNVQDLL